MRGGCLGFRQLRRDRLQINVIDGRAFAGHAVVAHGVGTVGANLHFEERLPVNLFDGLHRHTGKGEIVGELSVADFEINEFAEPDWGEILILSEVRL